MKMPTAMVWLAVLLPLLQAAASESTETARDAVYLEAASTQTEADEYTAYQLLAPETGSFRISYEVSATTPGAKAFYNPIRKGSVASDESVYDASSGAPLHFQIVPGSEARKDPLMSDADAQTDYIKVSLARPVPLHGAARLLILKTYRDEKSYYREGAAIVFSRPLGIRRNKVVLPAGYEVVALNIPSQILAQAEVTSWSSIAVSGAHAMPWCCLRVGTAPPAPPRQR